MQRVRIFACTMPAGEKDTGTAASAAYEPRTKTSLPAERRPVERGQLPRKMGGGEGGGGKRRVPMGDQKR